MPSLSEKLLTVAFLWAAFLKVSRPTVFFFSPEHFYRVTLGCPESVLGCNFRNDSKGWVILTCCFKRANSALGIWRVSDMGLCDVQGGLRSRWELGWPADN